MPEFKLSIAKAQELCGVLRAIHAAPKAVKGNAEGAVTLSPYNLSGKARMTLNGNMAALLRIVQPYEEAIEVIRKQKLEEVQEQEKSFEGMLDEDAMLARNLATRAADVALSAENEKMRAEEFDVELAKFRRTELNESANAFDPLVFGKLLNYDLVED